MQTGGGGGFSTGPYHLSPPMETVNKQAYFQQHPHHGNEGYSYRPFTELPSGPYSEGTTPIHELGGRDT